MENTFQAPTQPNTSNISETTSSSQPSLERKRNWKKWILITVVFLAFFASLLYFYALKLSSSKPIAHAPNPTVTQIIPQDATENWKTYTNSENMFTIQYPPNLYVKGGGQQIFLAKQDATDAEKIDYSDELVEIRIDTFINRFESYYTTPDNTQVKNYGDTKLKSYSIDGYKAVLYGYGEKDKEKEIKSNEEAVKSGASVGMIYFKRGLMVNKNGVKIEISTNSYTGEFKNTFDQILSTFKFTQ